jgi:hypothetical protein
MKTKLSTFCCLLYVFLVGNFGSSFAQEQIGTIDYNPFVQKMSGNIMHAKTTALTLPFFEDFAQYNAIPNPAKWIDRQVYINNTMAVNSYSRGIATFDAISQYGKPYDTSNPNSIRYADSLTSQQIDLSGKIAADSIYFSFLFQAAGMGFAPEKNDSLILYFKSSATSSNWIKVWSKSDSALSDFKQVMIALVDTQFLHSGFQFRFVNKASMGVNDDVWNIDYIRMHTGRNRFDTAINDVAFTLTPTNLLNDYTAMPYRQYLSNASAERASKFKSAIKNNFNTNQNIANFGYTAYTSPTLISLSSDAGINKNIAAKSSVDIELNTFSTTPSFGYYDPVIFENKYYLQAPLGDASKENDTIIGQQIFDNYLAYDDGTAEMSYFLNLFPTLPGKIAIEQHLNQPDTLRGVAIYFGRQVPPASNKYFSIVVYQTIAYGSSSADKIIYEIENLQPNYRDTINHFWIYKFDKAIPMPKGTFYIGTTQAALSGSDSLYIGLDRNRIGGNHAYYNVLNVWNPSLVSGALMIRPILGQDIIGSTIQEQNIRPKTALTIWPNPTTEELNFTIDSQEKDFYYEIKNLLGQTMQKGSITGPTQKINLQQLTSGHYQIQFFSKNSIFEVQQFVKK